MAQVITQVESLAATGDLWVANVAQYDGVTLHVVDNGNGSTITAEKSSDNSTWVSLGTTTAKGRTFYPADDNYIRFRVSTYVSGVVKIGVTPSTESPKSQAIVGTPTGGMVAMTQAQYDALPKVDPKTVYLIVG